MSSVMSTATSNDSEIDMTKCVMLEGDDADPRQALKPRAYQLEMLEESMRRNIIVALDTGAGKTLIAVLRIQAELERCPPEKFVWFCVPNVALAVQQYHTISTQLPGFQARVLLGADNCEYWTKQCWDDVLTGIRIVVSTVEILRDALAHGFVQMKGIALLIFDEAHHATKNHPASRIMRDSYHTVESEDRPAILGLTASPLVNSKVGNLQVLESNLNAISRTPKLHREELLRFVYQPELIKLMYPPKGANYVQSRMLKSLEVVYARFDFEQDPWVIRMRSDPSSTDSKTFRKALANHRTYCHDQIKGLYDKALAVHDELGSWATDYYIRECIRKFQQAAAQQSFVLDAIEDEEKSYLGEKFREIMVGGYDETLLLDDCHLTPKVQSLMNFLEAIGTAKFSGLVFVQTRAEVAVLSQILSMHTRMHSLAVSTFVGASGFSSRKSQMSELVDVKNQSQTLDDLREGRKNLIITTNALEEGIDVSACNVVICFDKPPNLKSFIQRRGRARMSTSKYVIMFEDGGDSRALSTWHELEAEMKQTYMDEMRRLHEIDNLENMEEEGERSLLVEKTGAKLTLGDAVQHLYHFCATLPADPYVDCSPNFFFDDQSSGLGGKSISGKVVLPISINPSIREAYGKSRWTTEKMAKRDAAFEAYVALYEAGLIDEHLLPLGRVDPGIDEAYSVVEKRPSLVEICDQIDIWQSVAREWQEPTDIYPYSIKIKHHDQTIADMLMILPLSLPRIAFELFWDTAIAFETAIEPMAGLYPKAAIGPAADITSILLKSVFKGKMDHDRYDFPALYVPNKIKDLQLWLETVSGSVSAKDVCADDIDSGIGLIRDLSQGGIPHILHDVLYASMEDPSSKNSMEIDTNRNNEPNMLLEARRLPKNVDFLHQLPSHDASKARGSGIKTLLAESCEIDRLPFIYSRFAMLIPSIQHKIQVAAVVERLCNGILLPLHFENWELVKTAISASSAREGTDYQVLEFLGDSILKFCTSLVLMAEHLNYHEGVLSHKKDHIVSNGRLASAAIQTGLEGYILTKPFAGHKWRPMYNSKSLAEQSTKKREISSKTLADVVEALIGASYLDGGLEKTLKCLEIFLPEVPWGTALKATEILYNVYEPQIYSFAHLAQVEHLISYKFRMPSLLVEALTHPSHHGPNTSSSYNRLEFVGDAILDKIVSTTAFNHEPRIPTHGLHLIRTALVNGHFLGFLCLTLGASIPGFDPVVDGPRNVSTVRTSTSRYLWQYMRYSSPTVSFNRQACLDRLQELQMEIEECLLAAAHYPWSALARLEPPKFFSDIVESILGAIYIDTKGSILDCQHFLEVLGIMPYLRRVVEGSVALLHPKEELGQLADRNKVKYVPGKEEGEEVGRERLTCTILVGEREVVKVGDGLGLMEVQTRAAEKACNILRMERGNSRGERSKGQDPVGLDEDGEKDLKQGDLEGYYDDDDDDDDDDEDEYMTAAE